MFLFLKASIPDLITLLSSSVQNSGGGGDGDSGNSCADFVPLPCTYFELFCLEILQKYFAK
jgi:hypothetical protein